MALSVLFELKEVVGEIKEPVIHSGLDGEIIEMEQRAVGISPWIERIKQPCKLECSADAASALKIPGRDV